MNRVINLLLLGTIAVAVVASFAYLELDLHALVGNGGLGQMGEYAGRFLQPDLSTGHLKAVWRGALETLAMSGMGTLLAMVLGMLLALPAAGRFGWPLQGAARLLLNALRAIPELVWAALTVLAAGLGPNAGTLALALHTAGVLGRLFAEALENAPPEPAAAIRLQGGSQVAAFCFGTLPNLWPQLLAYSLYRWEKSLFQEAQASTVIMGMLLLVLFVDLLSDVLRQRYVRA
ncbi:phosphonate ABC transporter, permease protein PhnE [Pseudomonas putida]|nr:ABC transporter permease subunit [Pseudomonas putida]POG00535.1 phosphonate ABC transporter, permease protein PhnE [Pseudomonas putida]